MSGPPPKRSDQRIRRNKNPEGLKVTKAPTTHRVKAPNVSPKWHAMAKDWYRSLKESGQSQFMENSDWIAARLVAHQMSMLLDDAEDSGRPIGPTAFEAIWTAMGDLLSTEGSRRRVRVELQRGPMAIDPDAVEVVSMIDDYRDMFEEPG